MAISDNKRIAMNTAVLYVRLVLSIVIGLYTSRLVLLALGASDYGLYTVVGGIVSMMNFLGTTMVSSTYRYITVEYGKGDEGDPNKVFNTLLLIHIILAVFLVVIGETLGLYYIENWAKFEPEKLNDAVFVLHMSLVAAALNVISIPYNGLTIAREKFVFTASVEVIRLLLKLVLVIYLTYYLGNRLRLYAIINALFTLVLPLALYGYCHVTAKDIIKWKLNQRKEDYIDIMKYTFWLMIGAIACLGQNQGANMIINLFFNTAINAAFGIAFQVNTYVMMFVQSINQATIPQIMKNQNGGNSGRSLTLVYAITKYAFFIMLVLAVPLVLNMELVLEVWLKEVPPFTAIFTYLLLFGGLIRCLGAGFDSSIQATGKIRFNQIFYSIAHLSVLPAAYLLYCIRFPVYTVIICTIVASVAVLIFQMCYLTRITAFSIIHYIKHTIKPVILVSILALPLIYIKTLTISNHNIASFLISSLFAISWIMSSIYYVGLESSEKTNIKAIIRKVKLK